MVKNIAYFPLQAARNAPPVLSAVLAGLRRHGITCTENSLTADAAIIWSVLWHGRMRDNQKIYEHYRSQGRDVVIIDVGCLHRGRTWKIALNHVTARGYYGHTQNLDPQRAQRLGLTPGVQRSRPRGHAILVACQHERSLQVQNLCDQADWAQRCVDDVRCVSDRPIVVRPHPRSPLRHPVRGAEIMHQVPRLLTGTYDSFDIQFDYHAVINHNSGPGIQAAMQGTPVVVDDSSLAHPVSISMQQIEHPPEQDLSQWFLEMCHTEWLLEEIEQGTWIPRLGLAC